ncbi:hypothetical protein LPJ66_003717 [Kickxella alabastrina]|uniref:Uncharacterized protein n=1 Tax=Kickxella alabastrina TaxID=61397 RepID=A0ACC1INM9_9FUNG|nr:hypothetical protein LPJ66_003717 [Kickxella alabastrina]
MNDVTGHDTPGIRILLTTLASVCLLISLTTLLLAIWLGYKRRELSHMTIFRVICALQLLKLLDSIFSLISIYINPISNAGCRIFVFLSLILAMLPLALSIFCILYFQVILLHNIPLTTRWPRVTMVIGTLVISLVPEMFTLFIPPHMVGMQTYCDYNKTPGKKLFNFQWLVFYIWVILASIIGIYSILTLLGATIKRSHEVQSGMSTVMTFQTSDCSDCSSARSFNMLVSDVVKDNKRNRRQSSNSMVAHTMRSIIWFPIAPIVCLGFNTVYSIVWYHLGKRENSIFIIDQCLQYLAVPLIAMTFYSSPPVKRAYRQYRIDKRAFDKDHCPAKQRG